MYIKITLDSVIYTSVFLFFDTWTLFRECFEFFIFIFLKKQKNQTNFFSLLDFLYLFKDVNIESKQQMSTQHNRSKENEIEKFSVDFGLWWAMLCSSFIICNILNFYCLRFKATNNKSSRFYNHISNKVEFVLFRDKKLRFFLLLCAFSSFLIREWRRNASQRMSNNSIKFVITLFRDEMKTKWRNHGYSLLKYHWHWKEEICGFTKINEIFGFLFI